MVYCTFAVGNLLEYIKVGSNQYNGVYQMYDIVGTSGYVIADAQQEPNGIFIYDISTNKEIGSNNKFVGEERIYFNIPSPRFGASENIKHTIVVIGIKHSETGSGDNLTWQLFQDKDFGSKPHGPTGNYIHRYP